MRLRQLKLQNFRQFYGDQEIVFSTDPDKHITLIHGENTLGKTTIQTAVIWCLFGRTLKSVEQSKNLVNYEAYREHGISHCEVRLEFDYEGATYEAKRVYDQKKEKHDFVLISTDEDGNLRSVRMAKELVNQILPDNMADYFFFEGEGLGKMIQQSGTRDAIRSILGFSYAQTVTEDLSNTQRALTKKLSDQRSLSENDKRLIKQISDDQDLEEQSEKKLGIARQNEKKYKALYDDKVAELTESKHEEISECQTKLIQCKNELARIDDEIKRVEKRRQALVWKYGWAIFGQKMAIAADGMIEEKELKGRVPAPHDEALVSDIIDEMTCICGRPITKDSPEHKAILDLRMTASNAEIKRKIMNARAQRKSAKGMYREFLDEVGDLERRSQNLELEKQRNRREETEVRKRQEEYSQIDVKEVIQERDRYQREWQDANHQIRRTKSEIVDLQTAIERHRRELNQVKAQNKRFEKYEAQRRFIDLLQQRCTQKLQEFERGAVDSLTACNNSALKRISRQDRRLELGYDLSVRYVDEHEVELGKSTGENLLLNLIFVSCLINFARQRRSEKDDFVIHGTIAPFLLDAPFGQLDDTYRERAVEYVAESTDQLIFLLSSSHWRTIDSTIRDKIGKEYILVNHQKDAQGERTDDVITVDGRDYSQSLFMQERKYTEVREIPDGDH